MTLSVYHLFGKTGCSGRKTNGTVCPNGKFCTICSHYQAMVTESVRTVYVADFLVHNCEITGMKDGHFECLYLFYFIFKHESPIVLATRLAWEIKAILAYIGKNIEWYSLFPFRFLQ